MPSKLGNQLIDETQHTSWHTNKGYINIYIIILLIIMNVKYKFNINVVIIQNMSKILSSKILLYFVNKPGIMTI